MGGSQSSIDPSVDPKADGQHSVQPPDPHPPLMSRRLRLLGTPHRRSNSPPPDLKRISSLMLDSSSSEEEAADVGSVQPPSPLSFMSWHRRKSISPPLDFKEGSSDISDTESKASSTAMEVPKLPTAIRPEGPDMDFGPIHHHPFQSPFPQSFMSWHRRKSISPPLDFNEGSSDMWDSSSEEEADVGSVQSPFRPRSTESFKMFGNTRSISLPLNFKQRSSTVKSDEVIQEFGV